MNSHGRYWRTTSPEDVPQGEGHVSTLAGLKERKGHGSSLALAALHVSGKMSSIDRESSMEMYTPNSKQYIGFQEHSPFAATEQQQGTHRDMVVDGAIRHGYRQESGALECKVEMVLRHGFAGHPDLIFVGVFEGHGDHGRLLALDVASFLPTFLESEMVKIGLQRCNEDVIKMLLSDSCDAAQKHLLSCDTDVYSSGVNVCFSVVFGSKAYIANLGNARVLVVSESPLQKGVRVTRASCDANPSLPVELERIQACGGIVGRFEDKNNIPYGSLRIFKDENKVVPGVTSSRMLGNLQAVECGVLSEPLISEANLCSRDAFIIVGSEGAWNSINDEDAARVVSQYSQHGFDGLTSADVVSYLAQRACEQKKVSEDISDVAMIVVNLRNTVTSKYQSSLTEQEIASLVASKSNEEAFTKSQDLRNVNNAKLHYTNAVFSRLETICHLHQTENLEFCERTSSLTQAMKRGDSGDVPQFVPQDGIPPMARPFEFSSRNDGLDPYDFVPSKAIGVPISRGSGRENMRYQSDPIQRLLSEEDLPPIRKAPLNLNSLEGINLISQRSHSQLDVWSFSEVGTPRSSDSNGSGRKVLPSEDGPHRGELRHEGKVHRGVPCSYNSVNGLRLSSDSDGSLGRHASVEDISLLQTVVGLDVVSPLKIRGTSTAFQNRGSLSPSGHRNSTFRRPRSTVCLGSLAESTVEPSESVRRSSSNVVVLKDINKFFN